MKNIFLSLALTCLSFSAMAKVDLNSDQNKRCEQNENNSKTILLLVKENSSLKDQVEKLKTDYARLELEVLNKKPDFDPRATAAACAKLKSDKYSKICYDNAKEKLIPTDIINVCMRMVRTPLIMECINVTFEADATAEQLKECTNIGDTVGVILACARLTGERKIAPSAIKSCANDFPKQIFSNPAWECLEKLPY